MPDDIGVRVVLLDVVADGILQPTPH